MTGVITTGNHPKALWPGIKAWFGISFKDVPLQYKQIFSVESSDKAYEEDVEANMFGLAQLKTQGGAITFDSHAQGPTTRYTHVAYALGYIVTKEEIDDNQYEKLAKARSRGLARSMRVTQETIASMVFNRAFNNSYVGGDGLEMVSTAHTTLNGTQSNELAVNADLSEASLEDLTIQIMNATDSRGIRIGLMPKKLVVPTALHYEAERILKSTGRVETANNDLNALKSMGVFPGGAVTWRYLTDPDAYFILTDAPDSLKFYDRNPVEFDKDNDFHTKNALASAYMRLSVGWSEWRGVYGCGGA